MRVFKPKKSRHTSLTDLIWKLYKLSTWNFKMLGPFLASVSFKYPFFYYDWFLEDNFFLSRPCTYRPWGVSLILSISWAENSTNDPTTRAISLRTDRISLAGKLTHKNTIHMKMGIFCMNNPIRFPWWKLKQKIFLKKRLHVKFLFLDCEQTALV